MDIIFIILLAALFGLTWWLIRAISRLGGLE